MCPMTIAIDCNGLSLLISEEKLPNYGSGPKSAPIGDCLHTRQDQMSFIWKDRQK